MRFLILLPTLRLCVFLGFQKNVVSTDVLVLSLGPSPLTLPSWLPVPNILFLYCSNTNQTQTDTHTHTHRQVLLSNSPCSFLTPDRGSSLATTSHSATHQNSSLWIIVWKSHPIGEWLNENLDQCISFS